MIKHSIEKYRNKNSIALQKQVTRKKNLYFKILKNNNNKINLKEKRVILNKYFKINPNVYFYDQKKF